MPWSILRTLNAPTIMCQGCSRDLGFTFFFFLIQILISKILWYVLLTIVMIKGHDSRQNFSLLLSPPLQLCFIFASYRQVWKHLVITQDAASILCILGDWSYLIFRSCILFNKLLDHGVWQLSKAYHMIDDYKPILEKAVGWIFFAEIQHSSSDILLDWRLSLRHATVVAS